MTPHILVDAGVEGVEVPVDYVEQGQIVLNVHPQATSDLELGDDWLMFSARFAGSGRAIQIPVSAVRAIFAKENGQGISFPASDMTPQSDPLQAKSGDKHDSPGKHSPHLRIIK